MTQPQTLPTFMAQILWLQTVPSSGPLTFPSTLLPGDPVTLQSRRPLACLTITSGILAHPCCAPVER